MKSKAIPWGLAGLMALPPAFSQQTVTAEHQATPSTAQPRPGRQAARKFTPSPGYAAADAAYKAYARADFAQAVVHAKAAVQSAPAHPGYRALLVNVLTAAGQLPQAELALEQALRTVGSDNALEAAREQLRRSQAQEAGAAMFSALQAGNPAAALEAARAAVQYAPSFTAYRLALVNLLIQDQQFSAAESAAEEALALAPGDASALALRAHSRQKLGQWTQARADHDLALQQPLAPPAMRQLRLLAADAALAAREPQRALDLLANLEPADAAVSARRAVASGLLKFGADAPLSPDRLALSPPALDCADAASSRTCAVLAGPAPQGIAHDFAAAAYQALEQKNPALAATRAQQATALAPDNQDYRSLLMSARVEQAYLAIHKGEDHAAREAFALADQAGTLSSTALQDAAFTALRAGRDDEAVGYFKRAVDAQASGGVQVAQQTLFETRRAVSELTRRWGVFASLNYRGGGGIVPGFGTSPTTVGTRSWQAGAEAYWRPFGQRNARYLEVFARGFQTLEAETGATGADSRQTGIGARVKPLTGHNLVLSLSRTHTHDAADNWLVQAGYSRDLGTDVRQDGPSWWTTRFSAEAGRYSRSRQTYGIAAVQAGRSYRMTEGDNPVVLFPHVAAVAEYDSAMVRNLSVGAGPGLSARYWFRGDQHAAPRSYADLSVQYRARISGDQRTRGWFLTAVVAY